MMLENYITNEIEKSLKVKNNILDDKNLLKTIKDAALMCINALKNKKKIIIAGNGGSAADAQHIAGELVSKFYFDRPGLSAIALTTDTSIITSIGNDYGYEKLFSRQLEANGVEGDVFIGISTSGNSKNILEALKECQNNNIKSIGLTGNKNGAMDSMCDLIIKVPSHSTPNIQESHIMIGHIICAIIEEDIFGKGF